MTLDYDTLAGSYALHRRVHPGVFAGLVEDGAIGPHSRVLEVGCGTGNYLRALRTATGCIVSGVEPSPEMLSRAPGDIALAQGRAEQLPLPDASVDLVFSVDEDLEAALAEFAQIAESLRAAPDDQAAG